MNRSFSVLILDGGDYGLLKVLRCLGQSNDVTSHLLSREKKPVAGYSRFCKKCHYNPAQNDEEWIEVIRDIVKQNNIDVLLSITSESIEFTARNFKALSEIAHVPPTPDYELLKMAQDKWFFYSYVKEHNLPVSPTILFADNEKIIAEPSALDSIEFPALLKPTQGQGGSGIIKIEKRSDFDNIIEQKKAIQPGQKYIVQSFIPGEDLCLGVCCKQGKILSYVLQKDISYENSSFGYQKIMEYIRNDRAVEIGSELTAAMKWDGMAFIDLRIDERDNSIKFIEINPRVGRALLGALVAGVNFPLNLCYSALGIEITDKQHVSARFAHATTYIKNLKSRIKWKKVPIKLRWHESGLRYAVSDPLAELVEIINKTPIKKVFR